MNNKIKTYTLSAEKKEVCLQRISGFLEEDLSILFAYAYGSFLESSRFRDLDIAVFLMPGSLPLRPYVFEIELENRYHSTPGISIPRGCENYEFRRYSPSIPRPQRQTADGPEPGHTVGHNDEDCVPLSRHRPHSHLPRQRGFFP